MTVVQAKDAKNKFGQVLDMTQSKKVGISKYGRVVAFLISKEELERLEAIEDKFWIEQGKKAEKEGKFTGKKEGEKLLNKILNASG